MPQKFIHNTAALFAVAVFAGVFTTFADEATTVPATQPSESGGLVQISDKAALEANKDKEAILEGLCTEAAWSNSGKVMNLRFEGGDESKFGAVVFLKNKDKINEAFSGDATKAWTGAKLRIKGKVVEYGGKAESMKGTLQVIITEPSQVTVVELPTTQPAS